MNNHATRKLLNNHATRKLLNLGLTLPIGVGVAALRARIRGGMNAPRAVLPMQKLGLSFLFLFSSLIVTAAAACGGTSGASEPQPTSSEAGDDSGKVPVLDGSVPNDSSSPDGDSGSSPDGDSDSSTIPNTPASGTVRGHAFTFAHGIAYPRAVGPGVTGYEIFLSDKPLDCASATLQSSTTVDIDIAGKPPAVQTYGVVDTFGGSAGANEATADFNALDATCGTLASDGSFSGTLILTKFDATTVSGSLDITFQSGGRVKEGSVKGTFDAVVCPKFPAITCTPQ